ncbi:unnamed protein product [Adineta ricciae]|uniref:Uncharacterized protein n=1 Tax=Adineta ricciae TaxID=249248 RepID=A0A815BUL5_ADIRI|nr:unnamed protein product [Adineta ricciae]
MPRASNRKVVARRRRERLRKSVSNHTMKATVSLLSKTYGLLPCFCEHDPVKYRMMILSNSSNALWYRTKRAKATLTSQKQQKNNSTVVETQHMSKFQTFRKSLVQRLKSKKKKRKLPTITARSVIRNRSRSIAIKHQSSPTPCNSEQSSLSPGASYNQTNDALEPPLSSLQIDQQNVNATDHTSQKEFQTIVTKSNSTVNPKRKQSNHSLQRRKSTKRKTAPAKPTKKRMVHNQSPFPDPNIFRSLPQMHDSEEITQTNIHDNHLCCKPITSVMGLSTSDQKKLIEHDYLTLISLLPLYLASQAHFPKKIQEKTQISSDSAHELDRLMNEWSSARLFIGATSPTKTLIQTI